MLFITNFFITFLLLEVTARLTKRQAKTLRLVGASALGGLFALTILLSLPLVLSYALKIAEGILLLIAAFEFHRIKSFIATLLVFLFSSFTFLGVIIGLYFITKSDKIAIRGGNIYFDIGARELLFCSFIAYVFACFIVRLYNKRLSKGDVYLIEIENNSHTKTLYALSDTGNRLREPFTNSSVIVANRDKLASLYDENRLRVIPASTVNSKGVLYAFKADRVRVKCEKGDEIINGAYIALSDDMNESGYSAVINPEILSV